MSTAASPIKVNDIPAPDVRPIRADRATIGEVTAEEVKNQKVMITVPLTYFGTDGEEREFRARVFIREEWLTPEFTEQVKHDAASIDEKELIMYRINVQGLLRSLFMAAGLEEMDFDALEGKQAGFTARPQKNDPTRRQISAFFPVKDDE